MISSAARKGRRRKGKEAIIESREGGTREGGTEKESCMLPPPSIFKTGSLNRPAARVRARERAKERGARGAPSQLQGKRGKAPPPPQPPRPLLLLLFSPLPSCAIRPSVAAEETGFPFPFSCCGRRRTNQRRTNERTADDRTTRRDANIICKVA